MTIKQSLYLELLNVRKAQTKDYGIETHKQNILNNFTTHPSFQDVLIEDIARGVLIVEMSSLEKVPNVKRIISNPDETLDIGNYVEWNSVDWIIVNIDDNKDIDYKGVLVKCESKLNWVDENGVIRTYPCTRSELNKTSLGGKETQYMIISDKLNKIYVQSNEFTLALRERDGLRFIFDEKCFISYDIERHIPSGVVSISLKEDEINFDTDKIVSYGGEDLWIADYTKRDIYSISITSGDIEMVSSSTVQLEYELLKNGEPITEDVTWSTDSASIATVNTTGLVSSVSNGTANITVIMDDNSLVLDSVAVDVVAIPVDNYSIEVNPDIDSILLGREQEFNTKLLNNAVDTTDTFTYAVVGGTASASDYVLTVIDGNNFKLENVDNGGNVIIRATSGIHIEDIDIELDYFY